MENLVKELNKAYKEHKKKFGVDPYVIGMFWNDREQLLKGIIKAIEENKPYNEYELLSDKDKKDFDNGELLF